eukprot:TRINITY_DN35814_c0_g1_i1.p1 TRINITY_DN35814_c0_g1~~TRINITY_DN35814_c0_g1_i1.p1  ORF type:complete len:725 (+),score=221.66 TRINITY_DN35814_c0_g1_i1:67-2175(+)
MAHGLRPLPPLEAAAVFPDGPKGTIDLDELQQGLVDQRPCEPALWSAVIAAGLAALQPEPNLLRFEGRVVIVGPLRGHFYDLLSVLTTVGDPDGSPEPPAAKGKPTPERPFVPCAAVTRPVRLRSGTKWLFLGDMIDGGPFSSQVLLFLLALKASHPEQVYLLRGRRETKDHEWDPKGRSCLLKTELERRYGGVAGASVADMWKDVCDVFGALPVVAVVNRRYWCACGGIGPNLTTPADLDTRDRTDHKACGMVHDVVWSDPMDDEDEELQAHALFTHNFERGTSYYYAFNAAVEFLRDNGLTAIIRGIGYTDKRQVPAQVTRQTHNSAARPWHYQYSPFDPGYRFHRRSPVNNFPTVVSLFSAPKFIDNDNRGAVLVADGNRLDVRQYEHVPAPFALPGMRNALSWSMPFVASKAAAVAEALWGSAGARETDRLSHLVDRIRAGRDYDKREFSLLSFERLYKLTKRRSRERDATLLLNGLAGLSYTRATGSEGDAAPDSADRPAFYDVSQFPRLSRLIDNWHVIRKEATEAASGTRELVEVHGEMSVADLAAQPGWVPSYQTATGRCAHWENYGLFHPQGRFDANTEACPQTTSMLEALNKLSPIRSAGFSLLKPNSEIRRHRDRTGVAEGSLALNLGLAIPSPQGCTLHVGQSEVAHSNGKAVLFDATHMHWARNKHSAEERIILYVDFELLESDPVHRE